MKQKKGRGRKVLFQSLCVTPLDNNQIKWNVILTNTNIYHLKTKSNQNPTTHDINLMEKKVMFKKFLFSPFFSFCPSFFLFFMIFLPFLSIEFLCLFSDRWYRSVSIVVQAARDSNFSFSPHTLWEHCGN